MTRVLQGVAALVIAALIVGLFKAKDDAAQAQAHVRALETQISEAQADLRELRAEIAALESPGRVEQLAREHLDLEETAQPLPESAIGRELPRPSAPARPAP